MANDFESLILRELVRAYQNCPKQVAALRRWWIVSSVIGWALMVAAYFLSEFEVLKGPLCVVIAAVGGIAEGWSFMYLLGAEQMPVLVRYTTLHSDEVQKRLEESKDA